MFIVGSQSIFISATDYSQVNKTTWGKLHSAKQTLHQCVYSFHKVKKNLASGKSWLVRKHSQRTLIS